MKKIIRNSVALVAALFCAATVSAQGIKIHKAGGEVIDIPASQLDYIEAYDATASGAAYEGVWKMKSLDTDAEYMGMSWGAPDDYPAGVYPSFNTEDELTIANGKIIPNLKSEFKNFFIGEATYTEAGTFTISSMEREVVTVLKVKGVNRNFSANSKSENDEAYIGVRVVEDEDADVAGINQLEVYLIDFVPTDFAGTAVEWGMYEPDENGYCAWMGGCFIQFTMTQIGNAPVVQKGVYEGDWAMKSLDTDAEYMGTSWGAPDEYPAGIYPAFNSADELTIADGKIIPNLKSEFKNFFIGEATYTEAGTYTLQGFVKKELTVLKVKGVNRNFSANSKSENDEAYIGVRVVEDEDADVAGVNLLEVYLIDYVPTDFAKSAVDFECYVPDENGYCAWMGGCYIQFTMKQK